MRITNSMLMRDMMFNINSNSRRMSKYFNRLSSGGQQMFRPSDDPVGVSRVLKYTSDIHVMAQFKKTVRAANAYNDVSESAVNSINEILKTIRDHCVAAADGTKTPDDIKKYGIEIQVLKEELVILGNTTNGGRYVFSGLETDQKLFHKDGSFAIDITTERADNRTVVEYEISEGEVLKAGTHPLDLFGMIENHNPITQFMPRGTAGSAKATNAKLTMDAAVGVPYNGAGESITVTVDGDAYTVDTSSLHHNFTDPLTKERLVTAIENAESTGNRRLSEVANIYYDTDNKLVIEHKTSGTAHSISIAETTTGIDNIVPASGTAQGTDAGIGEYDASALGAPVMTDAAIAQIKADVASGQITGQQAIVINYMPKEGKAQTEKIYIDFSDPAITDVASFQTALQTAVDQKIQPNGTIGVNVSDGNPLRFTVTNGSLKVDSIISNKCKLFDDIDNILSAINNGDQDAIGQYISVVEDNRENALSVLGHIGGKTVRLKYIEDRIDENATAITDVMSEIKYANMAELITKFKEMENIYRASLSVGSKIVQPSLVDFVR